MHFSVVCILLHLVFLISIFDIYFKTTITKGLDPTPNTMQVQTKRVVLIVADGLRADFIFNQSENAPYLKSLMESGARYGICTTRVPTESRPGHVALIAGIYEDPSAIFTGWQKNPTDFDSVFNRSRITYGWGSPDIMQIFNQGDVENVHLFSYPEHDQQFSGGNSSIFLNEWVIDKFTKFLMHANRDLNTAQKVFWDKAIFFLHLLGTDVAGHASKPWSKQYRANIRNIDNGVRTAQKKIEEVFSDKLTTYVFTSDHGMTDWGSHGAGTDDETRVPLIVWGDGTRCFHKASSSCQAVPTEQANIAPLISLLLGISIPVNSVGILPVDYLSWHPSDQAEALLINAKQLLKQLDAKEEIIFSKLFPIFCRPYGRFTREARGTAIKKVTDRLKLSKLIAGSYNWAFEAKIAINELRYIIRLSLSGINYYNNYFQNFLLIIIFSNYLGWILVLANRLCVNTGFYIPRSRLASGTSLIDKIFLAILIVCGFCIWAQALPMTYYVYCFSALLIWWHLCRNQFICLKIIKDELLTFIPRALVILFPLQIMVYSFSYRELLSLSCVNLFYWPYGIAHSNRLTMVKRMWTVFVVLLAAFPQLPPLGSHTNYLCVYLATALSILMAVKLCFFECSINCFRLSSFSAVSNIFYLFFAGFNTYLVTKSFNNGSGLSYFNQMITWTLTLLSLSNLMWGSRNMFARLSRTCFSVGIPLVFLSVGHEAFYPVILGIILNLWISLEKNPGLEEVNLMANDGDLPYRNSYIRKHINRNDFRRCLFFLLLIFYSFFGIGNVASINSFDPSWVRCYLTEFSPFIMMFLILYKTLAPFFMVATAFGIVLKITKSPTHLMFTILTLYCDIMGVQFFYSVKNTGSWLEIGTSLSHFVIMQTLTIFSMVLHIIAKLVLAKELTVFDERSRFVKYLFFALGIATKRKGFVD